MIQGVILGTHTENQKMWTDDDGVMYVGVIPFLLEDYVSR